MPNVTITIGTPQLVAGEKFKVRYRTSPNGAWSGYSDRTNASFVLSLAVGTYDLEIILVKADSSECPPTYKTFTVVEEPTCLDFDAEIVQSGSLFYLSISYTTPSPYITPACGYRFTYGGTLVTYATLPTSPILIPVPNVGIQLIIEADGCNGNRIECFNEDIPPISTACTPMVINTVTAMKNNVYPNGFYGMSIVFGITQSSPPSTWVTCIITQKNVLSGTPGQANYPNFTLGPFPSGSNSLSVPLVANTNVAWVVDMGVEKKEFVFDWLIVDACNITHSGTLTALFP